MNIVQIGTNRAFDNLSTIVSDYNPELIENLILVEPFDIHNDSIKHCYSNYSNSLYIENIVISPSLEHHNYEKIWFHPEDLEHINALELASLNKNHAKKIRNHYDLKDMKFLISKSLNINELFNKYKLKIIDILYIDTEGYDDGIIYTIDFSNFKIKNIFYENLHIDFKKLQEYLKTKNYKIIENIKEDPYTNHAIFLL